MVRKSVPAISIATAALLLAIACDYSRVEVGPMHDEAVSVDLGKIERANVQLDLGAGELVLRGGADKLLQGKFEYNVAAWKPQTSYSTTGSTANLIIRQPHGPGGFGHTRNLWDLALSDKVLLDFTLNCGAGEGRLDIGSLDLERVKVTIGAGQIDLDLRGTPAHDYDVDVSGGVGQATIRLPQNVGLRADAHNGIGRSA